MLPLQLLGPVKAQLRLFLETEPETSVLRGTATRVCVWPVHIAVCS